MTKHKHDFIPSPIKILTADVIIGVQRVNSYEIPEKAQMLTPFQFMDSLSDLKVQEVIYTGFDDNDPEDVEIWKRIDVKYGING